MAWDNPNDGTSDRGWVKLRFLNETIRTWLTLFSTNGVNAEMMIPFIGSGTGASKTTTVIDGSVIAEQMAIGDELYVLWHIPTNCDKTHDIIIDVGWYLNATEVAKVISGDVVYTFTNGAGSMINIPTGTYNMVDELAPTLAYEPQSTLFTFPLGDIPAAVDANHMHIKFERVASSNDPVSHPRLHHISIFYRRKWI